MRKRMIALFILPALGVMAMPAVASHKNHPATMSVNDIKRRVVEAQFKDKRLIIHLKNRGSVSGLVKVTSVDTFSLTHTHGVFGDGPTESIRFDEVASVEDRNQLVRVLKRLGNGTTIVVGGTALMLAAMPLLILAAITGHPVDC